MPVKNLRHIGIVTRDSEIAEKFYRNLLGLHFYTSKIETGNYIRSLLRIKKNLTWAKYLTNEGGTLLETWVSKEMAPSRAHIAFTVDNVDELYKKLLKNGIYCYNKPMMNENKENKVLFCEDYEGNLVELVEELK